MKKTNTKTLSTLRTSQDFNELLSMSELNTQMEVLTFLQDNLQDYQMNYLKSFFKDIDEVIAYIPQKDYEKYFSKNDCSSAWTYPENKFKGLKAVREFYTKNTSYPTMYDDNFTKIKKPISDLNHLIINTKKKEIYRLPKNMVEHMKFFKRGSNLKCIASHTLRYGTTGQFNTGYIVTSNEKTIITISLKTNEVLNFETISNYIDRQKIGWADNARNIKTTVTYD